jgi:hypothetical protein
VLCQLSYSPGMRVECSRLSGEATLPRVSQRRALGLLFLVLGAGLGAIAVLSALHGGRAWVVALAAGVIAVWLVDLARRALR